MPALPPMFSGPRKFPRIKLIWGASDVINARWRLGLFGFYARIHGVPTSGLAISVRGLLIYSLALGISGYLGGAFAISRWLARNPYNRIGFADVLTWPVRRGQIAELRGRAWLAQGQDALKAKRWGEAAFLLRRGLEVCPDDFDARLAMVDFNLSIGQRKRAMELIAEAPRHGLPSAEWRKKALALAAAGEDWETANLFCTRCLALLGKSAPHIERQALLAEQIRALLALDRAAEALAIAEAEGEGAGSPVRAGRVNALRALGRTGEALEYITRWKAGALDAMMEPIIELRVQTLREAGRFEEMDAALTELRTRHPERSEPLAIAVDQRARAGRDARASLDDFIFRFGGDSASLAIAANLLSEIPNIPLLQHLVAAAAERGYPSWLFRARLAEAWLRQGDWPAFAREVAGLELQFRQGDPGARLWFEWMQTLADALLSSAPGVQQRLLMLLETRPLVIEVHRLTAIALRRAGRTETARDALAISRRFYAESPSLRRLQTEVDALVAAMPAAPKPVLPPAPATVAADWGDFVRPLDEALTARNWEEAQRLISNARRARTPPAWLSEHEGDLMLREIRAAQGRQDTPVFRLTARLYLNGTPERAANGLALAREFHAAGARDDAIMLVQAVLDRSPDHPDAKALLAEWRPAPEKPKVGAGR